MKAPWMDGAARGSIDWTPWIAWSGREFKLAQISKGNVIYDNKPTAHLDAYGLHWSVAPNAQDQLTQEMNPELNAQNQQHMHQRTSELEQETIEVASASDGAGAAPVAVEAAAHGA